MSPVTAKKIEKLLRERGFAANGDSPNKGMVIDADYLMGWDLIEFLDFLVVRREKIFRSGLGPEISKPDYDDVVLAIEAVKLVIGELLTES